MTDWFINLYIVPFQKGKDSENTSCQAGKQGSTLCQFLLTYNSFQKSNTTNYSIKDRILKPSWVSVNKL